MTVETDVLGITITNGGGTFESGTLLPFEPRDGYAVGMGGHDVDMRGISATSLNRLCRMVASEFLASFVGTWVDGGRLHIDAVTYVSDRGRALAIARGNDQRAIYDFSTSEVIEV